MVTMGSWSALALVLMTGGVASAQTTASTTTLQPFSSVQVCTPFNVLIQPSSGASASTYQLVVDADADVKQALKADVVNGVLSLSTSGTYQTSNPIKVTVRLPADKLTGVTVTSVVGIQVLLAAGFTSPQFSLTNAGATSLQALGVAAPQATIVNQGTGATVLRGTFNTVRVTNQGTGTVFVSGATKGVVVDVGGTGSVVLDNANSNVAITGSAEGLAFVQYNRGVCSVSSQFGNFFGGACRQGAVQLPSTAVQWTCGLAVNGVFSCSGSSGVASTGGSTTSVNGNNNVVNSNGGTTVTSVGGGPGQYQTISYGGPGGTVISTGGTGAVASAGGTGTQVSTSTTGTGYTVSSSGGTVFSSGGSGGQVTNANCNQILLQQLLMLPSQ